MVDFSRRRRRRAEKMDPHGAEGAAPKKINISGAEGAAPENREKCTDCFTFGEDPIIELKQIIKLFHLSGCFTFQILAIIIELKQYYFPHCNTNVGALAIVRTLTQAHV